MDLLLKRGWRSKVPKFKQASYVRDPKSQIAIRMGTNANVIKNDVSCFTARWHAKQKRRLQDGM